MAGPRRGEVWWASIPGQPADPHQPQLVLVVSADSRNRARDRVMVVPIFSSGKLGPSAWPPPAEGTGLRYASMLFCEDLITLDTPFLHDGPGGHVAPERAETSASRPARFIAALASPGRS